MSILLFDTALSFKHSANNLIPTIRFYLQYHRIHKNLHKKTDMQIIATSTYLRCILSAFLTKVAYVKFLTFSIASRYKCVVSRFDVRIHVKICGLKYFVIYMLQKVHLSSAIITMAACKVIIKVLYHFCETARG